MNACIKCENVPNVCYVCKNWKLLFWDQIGFSYDCRRVAIIGFNGANN